MTTLLEGTPYEGIVPEDAKMLIHREGESSAESVTYSTLKQYPKFTTDGDVTQGDIVALQSSGMVEKVYSVVEPNIYTFTDIQPTQVKANYQKSSMDYLSNGKIVKIYLDESYYPFVVVGVWDGETISWGTPVQASNTTQQSGIDIVTMSENSFVIVYAFTNCKARVGVVSGTSITLYTEYSLRTALTYQPTVVKVNSGRVVFCFLNSGNGFASYSASVVGTVITVGSIVANTNLDNASEIDGIFLSEPGYGLLVWRNASNALYISKFYSASASITWGTPALITSNGSSISVTALTTSTCALSYINGANGNAYVLSASISGYTFTWGTPYAINTNSPTRTDILFSSTTKVNTFSIGVDNVLKGTHIIFDGSEVSIANSVDYTPVGGVYISESIFLNENTTRDEVYIDYQKGSDRDDVSIIYKQAYTSNYDDWLGVCQVTALDGEETQVAVSGQIDQNQTGLIPGTIYYLNDDGSLSSSDNGVKFGRALTSTSIQLTSY